MQHLEAALRGAIGRCPYCGKGRLFSSYLRVSGACGHCCKSFASADVGDGPAIFVMMAVGFVVVFLALFVEIAYQPAFWVHALLWAPATVGLTYATLRPVKGVMVALQFANSAGEITRKD